MPDLPPAIGPRTYLVGRILSALLVLPKYRDASSAAVTQAIRLADMTLDATSQSNGELLKS